MKTVLITGAAGNLGGLLAEYLQNEEVNLNLLIHKKDINPKLKGNPRIKIFRADLEKKETLSKALSEVDVVVHFAGVLFKHNPEKFLPKTNTLYFKNLLEKAIESKVKRIILISFPHVEGETFPHAPAKGTLEGKPVSVHARTRLQEEKILFDAEKQMGIHSSPKGSPSDYGAGIEAVSLRTGMVYGRGILMIDTARWFAKHNLLGIWEKTTWIHLLSKPDFLEVTKQAIIKENIRGIYHLGDEGIQTLQQFLDAAAAHWGSKKPWRLPVGFIFFAARMFELFSFLFGTKSPLTRDFVKIGMVSYYGDTQRMKQELLPELKYKNYREGMEIL